MRLGILFLLACANVGAAEVHVAVAANFATPAKQLAAPFLRETGHRVVLSSGSTGKFYAQIKSGAPFEVLLSADEATPRRLEEDGLAVPGTRFTYATGRLALWSARPNLPMGEALLRKNDFQRLAIANPRLAPYGAAAQEVLEKLGLWANVRSKLVQGENIAQTFQFVSSGNAELGFVALSGARRIALDRSGNAARAAQARCGAPRTRQGQRGGGVFSRIPARSARARGRSLLRL